ncbi:MAG: hypothetical protein ACRCXC_04145 [Legionella sp.]
MRIEECMTPVAVAYHLLQVAEEDKAPEETKKEIKEQLTQLFSQINNATFVTENGNYLRYLAAHPTTQEVIVAAHKEFLSEYLQEHSQKLTFVQRWLGYEGKLSQMASNQNYLLMFHAFTQVSHEPVVTLDAMRQAVNSLLDEYLETSWCISISISRKTWAMDLKARINEAENADAIIRCLSQAQIDVAKQDIEANKGFSLKSLHFFGHSRFQSTLSSAINLSASLSGKTEVDALTDELKPLMTEVTDNIPVTDLTVDELRHKTSVKAVDKGNASVLIDTLENALSIKNRQGPSGMIGRQHFFNTPTEESVLSDVTNQMEGIKNK